MQKESSSPQRVHLSVALALLLAAAPPLALADESRLVGPWLGLAEHNGQTGSMALEIRDHPEHGLIASLSLPDLEAWDIGAVPVRFEDGSLHLGPSWQLRLEPDGSLQGRLPAFLVPVHDIPVVFRRVDSLEKTPAEPSPAPVARPLWIRDLGSPVWAGLAVAGDLLFVGDDSGRLSALETGTGETRWAFETDGAIRARPTVHGATLYAHSDDGNLYALDRESGTERWRRHVAEAERVPLGAEGSRYNHYASSATVADGLAYVGGFDGSVVALDLAVGAERWRFTAGDTVAGTPAIAGGRVHFGSFDGNVYALDAATGQELWRYDTDAAVVSSTLVHDGLVVVGSRSYDLLALDAATGELAWKHYYWFSWIESSVTERDGVGYVGASDGQDLLALDLVTGRVLWRFDTRGSAWPRPAVTEDAVFIGAVGVADYWAGHEAAFLAVDRRSGRALWRFCQPRPEGATTWGFATSPAAAGSLVFTADLAGRVYAFPQHQPDESVLLDGGTFATGTPATATEGLRKSSGVSFRSPSSASAAPTRCRELTDSFAHPDTMP